MRVVQVGKYYHPYSGGIESHLYVLANALKSVVDLDVVVSNTQPRTVRDVINGVSVTRCASFGRFASAEASPGFALELSARTYDVLHLHMHNPQGAAGYLASKKPREHRLVVTYHSDLTRQQRLMRLYGPLVRRVLERADTIISTSPDLLEHSEVIGPFRAKTRIVPYGIDLEQFSRTDGHEAEAARIRARHAGGPLLLGVGRLVYYKGFEFAIRALQRLKSAKLLLIGDGPLRAELATLARELGVEERVIFVGPLLNDQVTPYYLASDVYVLPSIARAEAFGIVQIEAMACGIPIVNTRLPSGVPFVSRDGESGFTVPPNDPEALAVAVEKLLGDPELRLRFGAAGRTRAHAEFSKEALVRRLLALYSGEPC
jgi:glycosyltransferase involved in cell wall biosynthesis